MWLKPSVRITGGAIVKPDYVEEPNKPAKKLCCVGFVQVLLKLIENYLDDFSTSMTA